MPSETNWQKSSFSGTGDDNNCVEVTATATGIGLRESDAPTEVLATEPAALRALIFGIKEHRLR